MRVFRALFFLLLPLSTLLPGCTAPTLYYWGGYEDQIYVAYSAPGKISAEEQLSELESDYQKSQSIDKSVPPGYHAHMGYLYFQVGKIDQALQSFETEKSLFPESTLYMNRLIAQIKH